MRSTTMGAGRYRVLLALVGAATLAVGLLVLVGIKPAKATFPGQNGNIAFETTRDGTQFESNVEIYSMNPFTPTTQTNLTNQTKDDSGASYSPDGKKIAFASFRDNNREIYVMDANGSNPTRLTTNTADDGSPAFSSNGKIAFTSTRDSNFEIYVMDAVDTDNDGNGDNLKRLTANAALEFQPAFSPNGTKIAFVSNRDGNFNIYMMNATDSDNDGNGDNLKRLTKNIAREDAPSFSPDGTKILFTSERNGNSEIYRMKAKPEGRKNRPRNLTNNAALDLFPVFSPDGTKIAFATDRDGGNFDIYSMNADGTNPVNLTNTTATNAQEFKPDWGVFVP